MTAFEFLTLVATWCGPPDYIASHKIEINQCRKHLILCVNARQEDLKPANRKLASQNNSYDTVIVTECLKRTSL